LPPLSPTLPSDDPAPPPQPEGDEDGYGEDEEFSLPTLSGPEQTYDTEHFRIHYTTVGTDTVTADYVNVVGETLEHVWNVEINQMGWAAPPPDNGLGGDNRYDVYLLNIASSDTLGFSDGGFPETIVGDNPNTPAVETRASFSYLALDNDYAEIDEWDDSTLTPLDMMRSTAAHEFNHAIQFGYDGEEPADWLWEATATWMQSQVYPRLHDADEELLAVFKSPDTCQLSYGGETRVEDENHWYGLWIFLQYISENYGPDTVHAIWEHARDLDGYAPVEAALQDTGTSLDEVFRGFSLALLTRGFERGSEYPTVRLEGVAAPGTSFTPNDGAGQMAADYVEVQADAPVTIRLEAETLTGMLVGLRNGDASVFPLPNNQTSADAGAFDHLYLIVLNPQQVSDEYACGFTSYSVTVEQGGQPQQPDQVTPAPNFKPPQVEKLLDPEEYWGEDWDDSEDWGNTETITPPLGLLPSYVPAGYELYEAYTLDKVEYGEDAGWIVPGDGPATVLSFYGPDENFFDITASDSPYTTLEQWFDEMGIEPYDDELQTIDGVTILFEDWSEPGNPYSNASFIRNGQFIVVSGTLSPEEMLPIIESLIQ
ncbi:MAG: MXAN_6640 family putative metalloprotease, partial [Anaerolineales bacterium]